MFLGLLFCNTGFAKVFDFKCIQYLSDERKKDEQHTTGKRETDRKHIIQMRLDTSKKEIITFSSWSDKKTTHKITKTTDNLYISGSSFKVDDDNDFLSFNRYTGNFIHMYFGNFRDIYYYYWYSCEPTRQLY